MTPRLVASDGAVHELGTGVLLLEEASCYRLAGHPGPENSGWARLGGLGGLALRWQGEGADGAYVLPLGMWAGSQELILGRGASILARHPVQVRPRPEKLDPSAWLSLLEELEDWLPGVTVGFEGGLHGHAGSGADDSIWATQALLPLVPALCQALRAVIARPRQRTVWLETTVPMHAVRRVDGQLLRWLPAHPAVVQAIDRWAAAELGERDALVPQQHGEESTDHPANRYVCWLVRQTRDRLDELQGHLARQAKAAGGARDAAAWCRARAAQAGAASALLDALVGQSFLHGLRPEPPSEAALQTVRDDPGYARLQRLARLFLRTTFQRDAPDGADALPAPIRPSFGLYEVWTFLAVGRLLRRLLADWHWQELHFPWLREPTGTGGGVCLAGRQPTSGARLSLEFNPTFPSMLTSGAHERFSLTRERRPDLVLSWSPGDGATGAWLCLDAKYRVTLTNLADAFTSAHIYRDSLVWPAKGGRPGGTLLLVPSLPADGGAAWFSSDFWQNWGLGARKLTPGAPPDEELGDLLLGSLGIPR